MRMCWSPSISRYWKQDWLNIHGCFYMPFADCVDLICREALQKRGSASEHQSQDEQDRCGGDGDSLLRRQQEPADF